LSNRRAEADIRSNPGGRGMTPMSGFAPMALAAAKPHLAAMEPILKAFAESVALACELVAVAIIALAAAAALARGALGWRSWEDLGFKKTIWLRFAANITLALEFALAADISRTAIAPDWRDIGQLAAIAAIRTALNLFLERDIESLGGAAEASARATAATAAAKAVRAAAIRSRRPPNSPES
jgi:uncharacterized membrane protein